MDKETLSSYGWIVIITLVLAVMIALASPFGEFVGNGVVTVVNGFINTNSEKANIDNIDKDSDKWENKFSTFDKAGSVNSGNEEETLAPGLYDENDNLLYTWEQLTSTEFASITAKCWEEHCGIKDYPIISYKNGTLYTPYCSWESGSLTDEYLNGKLVVKDDNIVNIENLAFKCTSLTSIILPNSVINIGKSAFEESYNMTSISIPNSVRNIDEYAFAFCDLQNIYYNGTQKQWNSISFGNDWNYRCPEITVHCTDGDIIIPAWSH